MRPHRRQTMWVWAGPGTDVADTGGGGARGRRAVERRRAGRARRVRRRAAIEPWNLLRVFDDVETSGGDAGLASRCVEPRGFARASQSMTSARPGRITSAAITLRKE